LIGCFYNFGFFTLLAYAPFVMKLKALGIGFVFLGWGIFLALTSVFMAPKLQKRYGLIKPLSVVLVLFAILLLIMGIFTSTPIVIIISVIFAGALSGNLNTLITTAVMNSAPIERSSVSASYSFLRFIGGAIAPILAGKLAEVFSPHVPFIIGACFLVLSVSFLFSFKKHIYHVDNIESAHNEGFKYNIIAIERQYASGGRIIGEILAQKLGGKFYGEEILELAGKELNIEYEGEYHIEEVAISDVADALATMDELSAHSILGNNFRDNYSAAVDNIIKNLAKEKNVVFIGRAAANILCDRKDCLRVFIYADEDSRVKRAIQEYGIKERHAISVLHRNDKRRRSFFGGKSEKEWFDMSHYDVCLNSGVLGIEGCVKILETIIENTEMTQP